MRAAASGRARRLAVAGEGEARGVAVRGEEIEDSCCCCCCCCPCCCPRACGLGGVLSMEPLFCVHLME